MTHQTEGLVEEIYDLASASNWEGIIETLKPYIIIEPQNHWFLTMTGIAYYETKDANNAFHYIDAGLREKHDCPKGLWLMANLLCDNGDKQRAVGLWELLASLDPNEKKIEITCLCCSWETVGRTLVADSKLMLAVTYNQMGYKELAKTYRNGYLKAMSDGVKSTVNKEKVRQWLVSGEQG